MYKQENDFFVPNEKNFITFKNENELRILPYRKFVKYASVRGLFKVGITKDVLLSQCIEAYNNAPLQKSTISASKECRKMDENGRFKLFFGTWNNFLSDWLMRIEKLRPNKYCGKAESGEKTGTPHTHFFLQFANRRSFKVVQKMFPGAILEKPGNEKVSGERAIDWCLDYITKEHTSIGPIFQKGFDARIKKFQEKQRGSAVWRDRNLTNILEERDISKHEWSLHCKDESLCCKCAEAGYELNQRNFGNVLHEKHQADQLFIKIWENKYGHKKLIQPSLKHVKRKRDFSRKNKRTANTREFVISA